MNNQRFKIGLGQEGQAAQSYILAGFATYLQILFIITILSSIVIVMIFYSISDNFKAIYDVHILFFKVYLKVSHYEPIYILNNEIGTIYFELPKQYGQLYTYAMNELYKDSINYSLWATVIFIAVGILVIYIYKKFITSTTGNLNLEKYVEGARLVKSTEYKNQIYKFIEDSKKNKTDEKIYWRSL